MFYEWFMELFGLSNFDISEGINNWEISPPSKSVFLEGMTRIFKKHADIKQPLDGNSFYRQVEAKSNYK